MFTIFKYIGYALTAKKGFNKPEELVADTSFGLVEGFFIISFIILGLLGGGALFLGFSYGYLFFKIFGIILIIILCIDIMIFRAVKSFIESISTKVTHSVKGALSNNNTIDVDATDVH
ncbi:MAG: hypothetical protein ACJAV6_000434 [Candidatus Paceibacteria bacterium]|jgi:hypothetical protein